MWNQKECAILIVTDSGRAPGSIFHSARQTHRVHDFLDVVTVPASIEDYVIEAKGYQPVVVHKTILRDGYTRYKNEAYKARSGGR